MGEELQAGQERGEIATDSRPNTVPVGYGFQATHAELGLTRKEAAGYRAPISSRSSPPSSAPAAWASSSTS